MKRLIFALAALITSVAVYAQCSLNCFWVPTVTVGGPFVAFNIACTPPKTVFANGATIIRATGTDSNVLVEYTAGNTTPHAWPTVMNQNNVYITSQWSGPHWDRGTGREALYGNYPSTPGTMYQITVSGTVTCSTPTNIPFYVKAVT